MIRWGILGAGNIAHRFAASIAKQQDSKLVAISCRKQEKAEKFCQMFSVDKYYLNHDALLSDPEIDAIYLSLPHGLHKEWAIKALKAGKAVLCEKPAALNANEMREIADVAKETNKLFMEAMKTRFVPAYEELSRQLRSGIIGQLVRVEASLCNEMPLDLVRGANTYHMEPGQGGTLLDCGCYCVSWLEEWLPGDIEVEQVEAVIDGDVDVYVNADLTLGGVAAQMETAFDRAKPRRATLYGTRGRVVVEELHRTQKAIISLENGEEKIIELPYIVDDFHGQIAHFEQLLREGKTESNIMPLRASIRCAEIMDTIKAEF